MINHFPVEQFQQVLKIILIVHLHSSAGPFHFEVSGFTHFKKQDNGTIELSAYRMHDMDPIFFTNGFRFVWRNGDLMDDREIKCVIESGGHPAGRPAESTVTSYTWVYTW